MKIIFIRHGKTRGNLEKRYIGKTNEPLFLTGRKELTKIKYPDCDLVISSNMKRCIQTAEVIYPNRKFVVKDGLEECDFGDFEGKNYKELTDNPDYQKWIASNGKLPFPNGENTEMFKKRCITAFEEIIKKHSCYNTLAFVIHGGTIMSILEKYAVPKRNYFYYQIENGHGYITEFNDEKIKILEQI